MGAHYRWVLSTDGREGGGAQWAKLGGQAMQLDKALNFEDFG